mgnify:CR=1 FL=1
MIISVPGTEIIILSWPALLRGGQLRELDIGLVLVPVGDGRHIVLALEQAAMAHADLLKRHANVLLKVDGIGNVPPVEPRMGGTSSLW